ncbi:MAG: 3-isopropylmalate dehydratase small subunit [Chloroflexi bacterium]|nr:3-isopropylmalate dehydratase small subunit [Chloroflexota bacterium]MYA51757.1 3-isopropylmalate dehydratase small subunit [Chloroflexota bacterium]MYB84460.1 3-isopropylmalate dehydratase small subunit [Chloroflexota bacterium]MYF65312.1 3-isopropylmalate dehydratase small subunit [Chloroflexota bacterium]MYK35790.1 3-isopropylmalate dehydratase small subunit [Chloroflexota bacterium]
MDAFTNHTGKVVPYDMPNVDTDQIIPARFLKKIDRVGFGELLFYELRYEEDGSPKPGFILNQPQYAGGTILVSGPQFGIGSSREHAPWAIQQYGFRVVIAPSFGDIFRNNCYQNGLLPVMLDAAEVDTIIARAQEVQGYELTVDLETQQVTDSLGLAASFDIDPFRKENLVQGLDDIGLTLQNEGAIDAFESTHS